MQISAVTDGQTGQINRPFPSSVVSLFQNGCKCETFRTKMSSACHFIFMEISHFHKNGSHLDSLWNRGTSEVGTACCNQVSLQWATVAYSINPKTDVTNCDSYYNSGRYYILGRRVTDLYKNGHIFLYFVCCPDLLAFSVGKSKEFVFSLIPGSYLEKKLWLRQYTWKNYDWGIAHG